MIQAVETTKAVDGGKVWFIDVIGDKTEIDKGHLLSSVLWDMVPVYDAMVQDLMTGIFGTQGYQIGLENDSVRLLQSPHIPADIWSELMDLRDKIISGDVNVPNISDAQEVRALMTSVDINDG